MPHAIQIIIAVSLLVIFIGLAGTSVREIIQIFRGKR
jgi:hypothetical protein